MAFTGFHVLHIQYPSTSRCSMYFYICHIEKYVVHVFIMLLQMYTTAVSIRCHQIQWNQKINNHHCNKVSFHMQPYTVKCYLGGKIYPKNIYKYIYIYRDASLFPQSQVSGTPNSHFATKKLLASDSFSWIPTCSVPVPGSTQIN